MADFRIVLSSALRPEGVEQELEWDPISSRWSLSERGTGEMSWVNCGDPSAKQLQALSEFFRLGPNSSNPRLLTMSPKQLVDWHGKIVAKATLRALQSPDGGKHFLVQRLEGQHWLEYGRTKNFCWIKGERVNDERPISTPTKRLQKQKSS